LKLKVYINQHQQCLPASKPRKKKMTCIKEVIVQQFSKLKVHCKRKEIAKSRDDDKIFTFKIVKCKT